MTLGEVCGYGFINALTAVWIQKLAKNRAPRRQLRFEAEHGFGDHPRLRAGETHNTNASPSGGCGYGNDGVIKVQSFYWRLGFCTCSLAKCSSSRSYILSTLRWSCATSSSAFRLTS